MKKQTKLKTFIIRLENNEHSRNMAYECKVAAQKHGVDPHYFKAINGNNAEQEYLRSGVPKPPKALKKGRAGVLGCFFSHYYLWDKCAKLNQPIIILEHDGFFIRPLPDNVLDQFDDILKLDRYDPYSKFYNQTVDKSLEKEFRIIDYKNPAPKNTKKIGTGDQYFKGAYSYIIKPHAAKKLIHWIKIDKFQKGHRPADQQIGSGIFRLQTSECTVARLHPFYSQGDNIKTASLTGNPDLL